MKKSIIDNFEMFVYIWYGRFFHASYLYILFLCNGKFKKELDKLI